MEQKAIVWTSVFTYALNLQSTISRVVYSEFFIIVRDSSEILHSYHIETLSQ